MSSATNSVSLHQFNGLQTSPGPVKSEMAASCEKTRSERLKATSYSLTNTAEEKQTLSTCVKARTCSLSLDGLRVDRPKCFQTFTPRLLSFHLTASLPAQITHKITSALTRWALLLMSSNALNKLIVVQSRLLFLQMGLVLLQRHHHLTALQARMNGEHMSGNLFYMVQYFQLFPHFIKLKTPAKLPFQYFASSDNVLQHLVFCFLNGLPKKKKKNL